MNITNLNTHAASYVSVAELAAYWDVTRQLVYKHIQSGLLPAICLGPKCFRVRTTDALAFERLASSKSGNGARPAATSPKRPMQLIRQRVRRKGPNKFNHAVGRLEAEDGTRD